MISDIFLFPSLQEGLPVALMEAIAGGKSIVCSNIRGNEDLIENGKNGFIYNNPNINELKEKIKIFLFDRELNKKYEKYNLEFIKKFDIKEIEKSMRNIYLSLENNKN